MKRRILSVLTALALCLSLLPVPALAASTRTVTTASQLRDAVRNAGNGDTIKLGADITLSASDVQTVEDVCQFRYATQTTLKYDLVWQKLGAGWKDWNYRDEWGDKLYTGRFWENFNSINVSTGKQVRWLDDDGYTIHQAVGDTTDYEDILDATCGLLVDGKSITLDLDGHTLKGDGGDKAPLYSLLFVRNKGSVTITGSGTMDGGGGTAVTAYGSETTVQINSGNFKGNTTAVSSFNYAEVTITGGTFQGPNWTERRFSWTVDERRTGDARPRASDDPYGSGSFQQWRPKIHEILRYDYTAYGGTLYTEANGRFTISGNPTAKAPEGGTLIYNKNSIGPEIVKIQGGTFEGSQIAVNGGRYLPTISGGTFTTIPDPLYMQDAGSVAFGTSDGKYTVKPKADAVATITSGKAVAYYTELSAAVANVKDGQTVTLLKDHSGSVTLSADSNYTLDLGGKTVSGSITASAGTVSIQNGTVNCTSGNAIATSGSANLTVNCNVNANSGNALYGGGGTLTAPGGIYRGDLGGNLSLTGGKYSNDPSDYLLKGCYAEKGSDSLYSIKVGLSDDGYMEINSLSDFQNFATQVNGGYTTLNARLMVDITLSGTWTPIASSGKPYVGTFDGNGHKIRNLNINVAATGMNQYVGLFAYVGTGGTIQNLEIATGKIATDDIGSIIYIGTIAGKSDGKIVDCSNGASITVNTTRANYCGGIVGYADTVERCSNYGECNVIMKTGTTFSWQHVGGVTGIAARLVKDCYNTGKVSVSVSNETSNDTRYLYIGGICGDSYDSIDIVNCHNTGTVEAVNSDGQRNPSPISCISSENSYYLDSLSAPSDETATPKSAAQFASGEVTHLLNGGDAPNGPWYQNLSGSNKDSYPVLDPTHAAVYKTSNGYDNLRFSSITNPTISVNGGISLVELVSKLPKTVTVNSNIGSSAADVTWDTGSISYDPESFDAQTVTVSGTVNVTGMLNGGKKTVTATVNVKAVTVTSLTPSATPNLIYSNGGKLDLSALRLTAKLSNGKAQIVEHDTQGVTFKLGGSTIQDGLTLDKAQHNGKSLTVTYRGKTVTLGALAVKSTNNFLSSLTVSGQEAQYENGGYAVTLPPHSSLPGADGITVTLADNTASVTGKTELTNTGDEAQWQISVQAENGDIANYPLTVTVSPDYALINETAVNDFTAAWNGLTKSWNPNQAEVQQDVTETGLTHEQQLTYWLMNKLVEAGLEIPDKAELGITYTSGPDWAEKGNRYNHGGKEGSFTFTLTFTATAGDGGQNRSVSFEGNAGTIAPIPYDVPNYTVTFDPQNGFPTSSIQVAEDTPIGDQQPADPVKADYRFTGWYTETGVLWESDSPVKTNPLNLHAGWRWSQSITTVTNNGRIKAANEDAQQAGAYGEGLRMGDTVSITASAKLTEEPGQSNTFTTEPENFKFYLGDPDRGGTLLRSVPASVQDESYYTAALEVELTSGKGFAEGQNTIYVVFSGGDQLDGSRACTTLDIGKAMFTVTFSNTGDSYMENQYVENGNQARDPGDPTWTDHRFTGWESGGQPFSFSDPITQNTIVTATWEWAKSETGVTINLVTAGNPDAPRKTDDPYHIGDDVSIIATVKPAERPSESNAISLLDNQFTFYVGDPSSGGTLLGTETAIADNEGGYTATLSGINLGTTPGLTEVGTYDIYAVFSGNSTINPSEKHTTLNIRPQLHTVTFNSDGGSAVVPQYVEEDALVKEPTPPTLQDHRFTGWEDENDRSYDFNTAVTGPVTLTATWIWSKSETSVSIQWVSAGNPDAQENGSPIRIGDTVSVTASTELATPSNSMLLSEPTFTFYVGDPSTGIRLDSAAAQFTGSSYTASLNVPLDGKGFGGAGSYRIYAVFSGGGDLDGSSGYAELSVAPAIYTVTFNSNGGTPVEPLYQYIEQGEKIMEPAEPTKADGWYFGGWTYNGQVWNFDRNTVASHMALDAQWSYNPLFDVDGSVTDNDGNALASIKITLQRGKQIVFQTETDSSGQYHFNKVSPGFYNIVAERTVASGRTQTVTALVEITDRDAAAPTITMPPENVSSVLELPVSAPNIIVGGLNEEAIAQAGGTADTVTVSMAVAPKALVTGTPEAPEAVQLQQEQQAIQQQAGSRTLDFLEIAIIKDVAGTTSNITQTTNILEIIVDFQFNDRQNIAVYHYHNGQAEALKEVSGRTGSGQEDGTYYLDRENGLIHIFTQRFSLYAIGYQPVTKPDPSNPGNPGSGGYIDTYNVTIERSEHGKVTSNRTYAASGNTVTLTVTPDSGYVLGTLTVTDSQGREIRLTPQGDSKYTFTMPNRAVKVKATFVPLPDEVDKPCDGGADCPSRGFTDLGTVGTWYHEAVDYVLRNGLMGGYGGGRFGPNDYLSRAQFAQILFNKEGRPGVNYLMDFSDVTGEAWFAEAVRWAAAMGIVGGYGNGKFGPNDPITREQLAVMLWRYAGSPAATNKELHFADADEASGYALDALRWAVENGILNGYGDGRLNPVGLATRAQVAQMLKNFMEGQEDNT